MTHFTECSVGVELNSAGRLSPKSLSGCIMCWSIHHQGTRVNTDLQAHLASLSATSTSQQHSASGCRTEQPLKKQRNKRTAAGFYRTAHQTCIISSIFILMETKHPLKLDSHIKSSISHRGFTVRIFSNAALTNKSLIDLM